MADQFGVSRSPIREALMILEKAGLVPQMQNRGFYVAESAVRGQHVTPPAILSERESPYQRVANDWRNDKLPEEVMEQSLRDSYGFTKSQVQDILIRAMREGWAERKAGYGWRFLNVTKSPKAFQQIYQFRISVEPAAMLLPEYAVVPAKLEELSAAQKRMLDHDIERLPAEELLSNAHGSMKT